MEGWIIIVLIAFVLFVGFIVFDKRKILLEKIKKIFKFEKIKVNKEKKDNKPKPVVVEEKQDYDTMIDQSNVKLGQDITISAPEEVKSKNVEDIDLDKLFEELEKPDHESSQKYKDEKFNSENSFFSARENMSLYEMNDFLENSFSMEKISSKNQNILEDYGIDSRLSGKELGDMIKSLPPQIKAIIISDILKPKF